MSIKKIGNSWCVVHGHKKKEGSKTDKKKGTPIHCYSFKPGSKNSEILAKKKARKMHVAIRLQGNKNK